MIASGARYRRPAIDGLESFEGASVHYWASPLEAKLCAGQEVALVGAGNSAGQAAVYLASQVAKVWLLVRGPDLAASMSRYLVDRIAGLSNVEVLTQTTVTGLEGRDGMLEAIRWRQGTRKGGSSAAHPTSVPLHRSGTEHGLAIRIGRSAGHQGICSDRSGHHRNPLRARDKPTGCIRDRRRPLRLGEARGRSGRRGRAGRGDTACRFVRRRARSEWHRKAVGLRQGRRKHLSK